MNPRCCEGDNAAQLAKFGSGEPRQEQKRRLVTRTLAPIKREFMTIKANELLHSRIIENCIPIFNDGHYQHVALESMKQVELALIDKGIAPKKYFGVRLVKWLMGGQNIPLVIPMEEFQEQACTFFRGAFGYYLNFAANDVA